MTMDRYAHDIMSVLDVIGSHSRSAPRMSWRRQPVALIWARLLLIFGSIVTLAGLVGANRAIHNSAIMISLIVGLVIFASGVGVEFVYAIRTTKKPFDEHLESIRELLPREEQLLIQLETFELRALEEAQKRLKLESEKVSTRLDAVGGGALKASLVGVGALAYALLVQYQQADFSTPSLSLISLFGLALLLGMSVGGWSAKFGAVQWDYYSDLLDFVIDAKRAEPSVDASRPSSES